jgi:hypothetical protein
MFIATGKTKKNGDGVWMGRVGVRQRSRQRSRHGCEGCEGCEGEGEGEGEGGMRSERGA